MTATRCRRLVTLVLATALSIGTAMPVAAAEDFPAFDFTASRNPGGWRAVQDVSAVRPSADGLVIEVSGADPYLRLTDALVDFPAGVPMRVFVRLRSEQPGHAQLFYFQDAPAEAQSVRMGVKGGREWQEVWADLPPLGRGCKLRFDPPGAGGTTVLASVRFEKFVAVPAPRWPAPRRPRPKADSPKVTSGALELLHDGAGFGSFEVRVAGTPMAVGWANPKIGYVHDGGVQWVELPAEVRLVPADVSLQESVSLTDPHGATWKLDRQFSQNRQRPGSVSVVTTVSVDKDRDVLFLPALVLMPGAGEGSFGVRKTQAVFPGLEYLDDEPSSSEADVVGPGARRHVPDPLKITFPLMAVAAKGRYVGLVWDRDARSGTQPAAVFDSPDRLFGLGGHVMGLVYPDYDPARRIEGDLLPVLPTRLRAGSHLAVTASLIGGEGGSVVPAVQHYAALRPIPREQAPPGPGEGPPKAERSEHLATLAAGWLDSGVREGDLYRHAVPGDFRPQPAADAAVFQEWLAGQVEQAGTARRLRDAAKAAIARVDPKQYNVSGVSHVKPPVASLVYGHVAENAARAAEEGRGMLARFEPDGSFLYKRRPDGPDYAKTHFAPDASGLTAQQVAAVLERAAVSGDPHLIKEGLRLLRAMDKFAGGVPRGAQTWECPLHTPDILASAHLVRAYTLGYELTGDPALLESAKYWAWTGVPFLYLERPVGDVEGYPGIAVFGATKWTAPNWMGLPVQWCALVYAHALFDFHPHDPTGPWRQIAHGITRSGMQQTVPRAGKPGADPQFHGLLPDSFQLKGGHRLPPFINPGTLQANVARTYPVPDLYDFHSFRAAGGESPLLVHVPGQVDDAKDEPGRATFTARGWPDGPYYVLVSGLKKRPRVRIDGAEVPLKEPHQYVEDAGRLVLRLKAHPRVEIIVDDKP